MARYKQLLFYANKLPAMPAEDHKPENKVEGCVSQVGSLCRAVICLTVGSSFPTKVAAAPTVEVGGCGRSGSCVSRGLWQKQQHQL